VAGGVFAGARNLERVGDKIGVAKLDIVGTSGRRAAMGAGDGKLQGAGFRYAGVRRQAAKAICVVR